MEEVKCNCKPPYTCCDEKTCECCKDTCCCNSPLAERYGK